MSSELTITTFAQHSSRSYVYDESDRLNKPGVPSLFLRSCLSTFSQDQSTTATIGFRSRDPIGFVDGENLYQYVTSKPLHSLDPSGLVCWQFCTPGGNPNQNPTTTNPSGPFGPHNPQMPDYVGMCIMAGFAIDCCLGGPSGEGGPISGCFVKVIDKCCDAVKAAKLAKQMERLREQLDRINDEIESLQHLLELVNQQLANSPYESPQWHNDVQNKARIEQDLRRTGTTKRRLLNELIDLGRKGC